MDLDISSTNHPPFHDVTRPEAPEPTRPPDGRRFEPGDDAFTLREYLREIAPVDTLTREQEFDLWQAMRGHESAYRDALAAIPFTARHAVRQWRTQRAEGRTTAKLSARWRDPGAGDPGPALDRALARTASLLDRGVRSEAERRALALQLLKADLAMRIYDDAYDALVAGATSGSLGARETGLPLRTLRTRLAELARHRDGLLAARNEFVHRNLKLVVFMAKEFRGLGIPFTDLIQEGNLGLVRAVEKFDAARGFKFSTYAAWWIRQSFIRAAQNHSRTVRLPSHVYELAIREKRMREELSGTLGRTPSREEMAGALGVADEDLEGLYRATRKIASLDAAAPGREEATLADVVRDAPSDPTDVIHEREIQPEVASLLLGLRPRQRAILQLRFGLEGQEPHTLQEIGAQLGLSRERVRQIEREALAAMRTRARARGLHDALHPLREPHDTAFRSDL